MKPAWAFALWGLGAGLQAGNASLAGALEDASASARGAVLGSAYAALADDSSALFSNPAGLAWQDRADGALHHHQWLGGVGQQTAALGLPLGRRSGLGLSAGLTDFGSFDAYDENGALTGTYNMQRLNGSLGWATRPVDPLALGATLKVLSQSLAGQSSTAFSADLGLAARLGAARLGLAYTQLGSGLDGSPLASSLRAAGAWVWGRDSGPRLSAALGGQWQPQGEATLQAGLEGQWTPALALRGGWQQPLGAAEREGLQGLVLGAGFRAAAARLDYAWQPFGDLGASHRVSLHYDFYKRAEAAPEPRTPPRKPPSRARPRR